MMSLLSLVGQVVGGVIALALLGLLVFKFARDWYINRVWHSLEVEPGQAVFSEAMIADLPPLAQRYLRHSIQPGARLASSVQMKVKASIQEASSAPCRPFIERRIVTPYQGGLWDTYSQARRIWARSLGYYAHGTGWEGGAYWNLIPIRYTLATPFDSAKFFIGRLLVESVLIPSTLLPHHGVRWEAIDDEHVCAIVVFKGETMPLRLKIDCEGRLQQVEFQYWNAKGADNVWRYIPCALQIHAAATFGDYAIPSEYTHIFWHNSPERERGIHIHYTLEEAIFS